jgi:hypothetical protein
MAHVKGKVGSPTQVGWTNFWPDNSADYPEVKDGYMFLTTSAPSDNDPADGRIPLEGRDGTTIEFDYGSYNQDANRGYCWWFCNVANVEGL